MLIKRANGRKPGGRAGVLQDEVKVQDALATLEKGPKLQDGRWWEKSAVTLSGPLASHEEQKAPA